MLLALFAAARPARPPQPEGYGAGKKGGDDAKTDKTEAGAEAERGAAAGDGGGAAAMSADAVWWGVVPALSLHFALLFSSIGAFGTFIYTYVRGMNLASTARLLIEYDHLGEILPTKNCTHKLWSYTPTWNNLDALALSYY